MGKDALDPDVKAAADRGDLVEAIKLLRHRSGLGLREARDAVHAYLRGEQGIAAPGNERVPVAAVAALHEGKLIDAIRLTRDATHLGLKESKEAVEHYLATNPMAREQFRAAARRERRPLRTIFLLALIVAALIVALRALIR
jgi:ribosomal protein L7/L12